MAKIISRDPDFQKKCGNCGVTFSYTRSEVRIGQQVPHDPEGDHYSVVNCPGCNQAVNVGRMSAEAVQARREEDMRSDYDL